MARRHAATVERDRALPPEAAAWADLSMHRRFETPEGSATRHEGFERRQGGAEVGRMIGEIRALRPPTPILVPGRGAFDGAVTIPTTVEAARPTRAVAATPIRAR